MKKIGIIGNIRVFFCLFFGLAFFFPLSAFATKNYFYVGALSAFPDIPTKSNSTIHAGAYFGVETHFNLPWVGLLNHWELFYANTLPNANLSIPRTEIQALKFNYTIGARFYLGIPYIFLDAGVGLSYSHAFSGYFRGAKPPSPSTANNTMQNFATVLFRISLGFNFPIKKDLDLQVYLDQQFKTAFDDYDFAVFGILIGVRFHL